MLDAAERVIRRDGAGVSLETIAIEAGVTKPIIYARVGGRTELANALAERLSDRLFEASRTAMVGQRYGRGLLAAFIEADLTVIEAHREMFLYVTGGSSDETPKRTMYLAERSATPLAHQLAAWRTSQNLDPSGAVTWAYGVIGMIQMVALWWISESDAPAQSAAEVAAQVADLLWVGLSGA